MLYFNTLLQLRENTRQNCLSGVAETAMTTTAPSGLGIYCQWVAASQLKATFVWPPWNSGSQHSHTHSPEVCVSKRFELNAVTSCSRGQALSVGHNPPVADCTKGLWKHTRIEDREKMFPTVSPALSGLLLCSQCALERPVSVSINSVTLSGDTLRKTYKGYDRIWFIPPYLFS